VEEAERGLGRRVQILPIGARRLQQHEGSHHVGLDEIGRAGDRAIDMAFGRQVHDAVGPERGDGLGHGAAVANVGPQEAMIGLPATARSDASHPA
jgi:hypothetical protein